MVKNRSSTFINMNFRVWIVQNEAKPNKKSLTMKRLFVSPRTPWLMVDHPKLN